jgi:hypothetical protein
MKNLFLFLALFMTVTILNAQQKTIGFKQTISLPDGTSGNFLTVGQIVIEPLIYKVEIKLFKTQTSFEQGKERMPYRAEIQFPVDGFEFTNEALYDKILQDSLFLNAERILN